MADKHVFEHDSLQDLSSLVEYLKAVVEGFEQGKLKVAGGEEEIELEPTGLVRFEVRASQREDRARLALRFTWKPKRSEDTQDDKLRIGSS
ncbi:MAG: amphi-Trp domain-containing protein [Myxococcales bacterium]|nr:amphi-Trp domain-containing protein [Myxococcales bacterium]MDD9965190.1 amphi-Trp domain-containing protein [Myxococcales bacterium]